MLANFKKNRFWFIKALETWSLAVYFIAKRSTGVFHSVPPTPLEMLDDPPFIFLLGCVGTIALVYSLWNVKHLYYKPLMTGLLTCVWLVFFMSFVIADVFVGRFISFPAIYAFFVLSGIVAEVLVKG